MLFHALSLYSNSAVFNFYGKYTFLFYDVGSMFKCHLAKVIDSETQKVILIKSKAGVRPNCTFQYLSWIPQYRSSHILCCLIKEVYNQKDSVLSELYLTVPHSLNQFSWDLNPNHSRAVSYEGHEPTVN